MQRIIDTHIHLSSDSDDALVRYARLNGLNYTMHELLDSMKKYNVEHGLLLSPPSQENRIAPNDKIIELCEKSNGVLAPVITVEPSVKDVQTAIKLAEENEGYVKAFKIRLGYVKASAEDIVFDKLYDYAEAEGLPVLFHTGDTAFKNGILAYSHPLTLDGLANKRDNLTIVACHFGNPWFNDVAELLYKHPNVYTDTSGLITAEGDYVGKYVDWLVMKMNEAIYYAGNAEKVLFGTDYPVSKHSDMLKLIDRLDLNEKDKEKILGRNAERVFHF